MPQPDRPVERLGHRGDPCRRPDVPPGGEEVGGIQADAEPRRPAGGVQDLPELLEGAPDRAARAASRRIIARLLSSSAVRSARAIHARARGHGASRLPMWEMTAIPASASIARKLWTSASVDFRRRAGSGEARLIKYGACATSGSSPAAA